MIEIIKTSSLQPASFENNKPLSYGQKNLLKLLTDKINNKEVVTKEDIVECYWEAVCDNDGKIIRWEDRYVGLPDQKWKQIPIEYNKNSYKIKSAAMQWFKTNLGNCILKGKLLVIPVIEI